MSAAIAPASTRCFAKPYQAAAMAAKIRTPVMFAATIPREDQRGKRGFALSTTNSHTSGAASSQSFESAKTALLQSASGKATSDRYVPIVGSGTVASRKTSEARRSFFIGWTLRSACIARAATAGAARPVCWLPCVRRDVRVIQPAALPSPAKPLPMLTPALSFPALFASRVFLPLFAVALAVRFGPDIPVLSGLGLLAGLPAGAAPGWLASDLSLVVLGGLSLLELVAHKQRRARELLNELDPYVKPVSAAIGLAGLLGATGGLAPETAGAGAAATAGLGFAAALVAAAAAATFLLAIARRAVLVDASEADADDDTGLFGLFSWGEDLWSVFGVFLLVLFPLVVAVLVGLVSLVVLLLFARAKRREHKARVPCDACGERVTRAALRCPRCGVERPNAERVGLLGGTKLEPVTDRAAHAQSLRAAHRCPSCAGPLKDRHPDQDCPTCGRATFASTDDVRAYDAYVTARLPWVLAACAGFSLVPVVGLVPGIILYRMTVVAPYRRYLPRGRTLLVRWGVRLAYLFLIFVQLTPVTGTLAVPAMALLGWSAYRRSFRELAAEAVGAAALSPVAQPA